MNGMASVFFILSASFLFSVLSALVSASPAIPAPSTAPKALSVPPAWVSSEVTSCSAVFSHHSINPLDCLTAFAKLPVGATPIQFSNNARWPYNVPQSLPLKVTHKTCAMKITASGRNATSLNTVQLIPDHIREMAAWVSDECVLTGANGGLVTRQIINTKAYLAKPNVDVNFEAGFPTSTTFYSLLIWYRPLAFDHYNPGNHDPAVGYELDDFCLGAAEAFPRGSPARKTLMARSDRIETAFDHQERNPEVLVNWWDHYPPGYPEGASMLAGARNLTDTSSCINKNCSALLQERSVTSE